MPHPVAKHLYEIQAVTGDPFFRIFDDWLGLAVAALSQAPDKEDRYMAIMRRYGPRISGKPHPADSFSKALGAWLLACQTESARDRSFGDILGQIYEEESVTNRFTGQFFTPEHLCKMMARMIIEPTDEPVSIADPACGSGRLLIAAQPLAPNATLYGIDRDLTCVHMTVLNMLVRNANAVIIHGNTLSLETFIGYAVRHSPFGATLTILPPDQAGAVLGKASAAVRERDQAQTPPSKPTSSGAPSTSPQDEPSPTVPQPFVGNRKGQFDFGF